MFSFREVWVVDFEFNHPDGESLPTAVYCMVAWELHSGRKVSLWQDQLKELKAPPYSLGRDSLFVSYSAHAELSCHLALGWALPERILDLYFEFVRVINVTPREKPSKKKGEGRASLLRALTYYGLDGIRVGEKDYWRALIETGGPFTEEQKLGIMDIYCASDVDAAARLLATMMRRGHIDIARALFRGRYSPALTRMQMVGVPLNQNRFELLRRNEESVKRHLLQTLGSQYGDVYDEHGHFGERRFARYLVRRGWSWPLLENGDLDLKERTFKAMAEIHPELENLRQLRFTLDKLKLVDLKTSHDGFNRCWLAPFSSRTGRNQPSNAEFIFGPAVWLRSFLIQARPGMALAYLDWQGQEAGIAAALSRDAAMIEAYLSKDCYITFGVQAGLLPDGATEETHGEMRGRLKITWLSTQYGTGYYSLAERLDCAHIVARNLLASHRRVYNTYWKWSDNRISRAYQYNCQSTVFGWTHTFKERPRVNSVRNFPIQGNGSEMMRLAACLMTENGIDVCAPVHDAFLITAPSEEIEAVAARALTYMGEASAAVLNGFGLKTDKQHIFKYPEYYRDPKGRGEDMVARVEELLKLL
jgi:DNA polymerase I